MSTNAYYVDGLENCPPPKFFVDYWLNEAKRYHESAVYDEGMWYCLLMWATWKEVQDEHVARARQDPG